MFGRAFTASFALLLHELGSQVCPSLRPSAQRVTKLTAYGMTLDLTTALSDVAILDGRTWRQMVGAWRAENEAIDLDVEQRDAFLEGLWVAAVLTICTLSNKVASATPGHALSNSTLILPVRMIGLVLTSLEFLFLVGSSQGSSTPSY